MSDEWAHRENCPDGACIGLIGPDGTCKVCGRAAPNWGDERRRGMVDAADDAEGDQDAGDREIDDEESYENDEDDADDGDDGDDADGDDADEDDDAADDADDDALAAGSEAGGSPAWSKRQLCSDGACVGVIGDNGKCKVCGKAAA